MLADDTLDFSIPMSSGIKARIALEAASGRPMKAGF